MTVPCDRRFVLIPPIHEKKTVWEDLAEIDYSDRPQRQEIVDYFRRVVSHYVGLGIYGFRCDAAYKVPKPVWRDIIDSGRREHDGTLFVAENLGAMMEEVEEMRGAGFDYLFNSAKWWDFREGWLLDQYEKFRSIAPSIAFPETHDTARLAEDLAGEGVTKKADVEKRYRQAYLFSAVFSAGVMIPMGYEYGFKRRLHVVETRPKHWEKPTFDLTAFIASVNRMKVSVPVLNEEGPQRAIPLGDGRVMCLFRRALRGRDWALSVINTDWGSDIPARIGGLHDDVRGGREVTPGKEGGVFDAGAELRLQPGEIRVFANT